MKVESEEVLRIAKAVAVRYKARCWYTDVRELTNVAWEAVNKAQQTFDPQVGVPFEAYAAKAAMYRVRNFLWKQSSPLSGGLHDPQKNIAGVHASQIPDDLTDPRELRVDEQLMMYERRMRMRLRIRKLAARTKDGDLAVQVILEGAIPQEIIKQSGRRVYSAVHLVRRKVRSDARLYRLWQQGGRRR
jgi:hypothetical protein